MSGINAIKKVFKEINTWVSEQGVLTEKVWDSYAKELDNKFSELTAQRKCDNYIIRYVGEEGDYSFYVVIAQYAGYMDCILIKELHQ